MNKLLASLVIAACSGLAVNAFAATQSTGESTGTTHQEKKQKKAHDSKKQGAKHTEKKASEPK